MKKEQPVAERRKREYVLSSDLACLIEEYLARSGDTIKNLAGVCGVSPRAIAKVLRRERRYQTVFFADRILVPIGHHICEMEIHRKAVCENVRGREKPRRKQKR